MSRVITRLEDIALENGFEVITDTAVHNYPANKKPFVAVQAVTATVIAVLTPDTTGAISGNAITTLTLPPNAILYGRFTSIQLTSGTCVAYKGV